MARKAETEVIAQNIMKILARTGNQWRELSWEEYESERKKDGNFSEWAEREHFKYALYYTLSAQNAAEFCEGWRKVYNGE